MYYMGTLCNWAKSPNSLSAIELSRNNPYKDAELQFSQVGVHERRDLQRLLRDQIDVISPDTLIISEEFGDWEDSKRRVDLLGLDREAKLVVVELKRTEDGGHMELQSIRYAAMVSTMTFGEVVEIYNAYLASKGPSEVDARSKILEFLEWDEPDEDAFAQDVRIILVSAEFSKEVTSAVMWLNDQGLDIQCFRLKPYNLDGRLLVDVQQLIPLPEAAAYQFKRREKDRTEQNDRLALAVLISPGLTWRWKAKRTEQCGRGMLSLPSVSVFAEKEFPRRKSPSFLIGVPTVCGCHWRAKWTRRSLSSRPPRRRASRGKANDGFARKINWYSSAARPMLSRISGAARTGTGR